MSNDNQPVEYSTDTYDTFACETLTFGHSQFQVFSPNDERPKHASLRVWGNEVTLAKVDAFTASTGEQCLTLRLRVDGGTVDLNVWGVTLDTLATAVEAAQRD